MSLSRSGQFKVDSCIILSRRGIHVAAVIGPRIPAGLVLFFFFFHPDTLFLSSRDLAVVAAAAASCSHSREASSVGLC